MRKILKCEIDAVLSEDRVSNFTSSKGNQLKWKSEGFKLNE